MAYSIASPLYRRREVHTAALDSGATGHFDTGKGGMIPTEIPSNKIVEAAGGEVLSATTKALLPQTQLRDEARAADIIPGLMQNLISVSKLSDAGYMTIFYPGDGGAEIYDTHATDVAISGAPPVVEAYRDDTGLFKVPLVNENKDSAHLIQQEATRQAAYNVFELPSIRKAIRHIHASIGFPTKATWLRLFVLETL